MKPNLENVLLIHNPNGSDCQKLQIDPIAGLATIHCASPDGGWQLV